jgi:hypothetical protein
MSTICTDSVTNGISELVFWRPAYIVFNNYLREAMLMAHDEFFSGSRRL